jgi:hypothetical protein
MRWDYDQTISVYLKDKIDIDKKISELKAAEQEAKNSINKHKDIIVKQQKNTINIEDSIRYINNDNDLFSSNIITTFFATTHFNKVKKADNHLFTLT